MNPNNNVQPEGSVVPTEATGAPRTMNRLNQVTTVSKVLAAIIFIMMPFIGGYVGYVYAPEKIVEVPVMISAPAPMPNEVEDQTIESAYPVWLTDELLEEGNWNNTLTAQARVITYDTDTREIKLDFVNAGQPFIDQEEINNLPPLTFTLASYVELINVTDEIISLDESELNELDQAGEFTPLYVITFSPLGEVIKMEALLEV